MKRRKKLKLKLKRDNTGWTGSLWYGRAFITNVDIVGTDIAEPEAYQLAMTTLQHQIDYVKDQERWDREEKVYYL